ncbi:glutathione S-transferase T1 [Jatropha curcas]|uniref:glutathione S-transferase T1 n=1 Tax=Jatropha curcas TaxID=180498 RepID=UPI00189512BA|nr:glutathione S-transferase T1 [Jatropha curcas]
MGQVPAIVHDDFKLFESHAVLTYLACAFPGVTDHWYPADLRKRAKVQSVLDWHHSTLSLTHRTGQLKVTNNFDLCSVNNRSPFGFRTVGISLLLEADQPSFSGFLAFNTQSQLLEENDRNRLLDPYKKVQQWIENTKTATNPHFDELHGAVFQFGAMLNKQQ